MSELHFGGWQSAILPTAILLVAIVSTVWLQSVSQTVPEPYLVSHNVHLLNEQIAK